MYKIKIVDRTTENDILFEKDFYKDEIKAINSYEAFKNNAVAHKNDFYDEDKNYKYTDIKLLLEKNGTVISYFTIGNK